MTSMQQARERFETALEDAFNEAGRFIDYFDLDDPDQEPMPGFEGEYFDHCGNCIARVVGGHVWPIIEAYVDSLEDEIAARTSNPFPVPE